MSSRMGLFLTSAYVCSTILSVALLAVVGGCPPTTPPQDGTTGDSGIGGEFVGSERCSLCHQSTHTDWAKTLHAKALESLEAIGQDTNATCVPCHVVGFGETGGFVDRATTNDLANVGCEACHGGARAHAENASDRSLRPDASLASEVCGRCHTGSHHPHIDEWQEAGHATINEDVAADLIAGGFYVNSCGPCHSGEVFYLSRLQSETVADDHFAGDTADELVPITCAVCHDPHAVTDNAAEPEDGRDFQLRFPEVVAPTPTNTVDAATDPTRFNLCGQCHHSRGREWTATSRGPHHSVQANIYAGEMPLPADDADLLVFSRVSVHSFASEQCATCHMYRQDFQDEQAPAISGHTFEVNQASCTNSGCHPSIEQALAVQQTLQTEIQGRLDAVKALLGDPSTWEYEAGGGPADQSTITDTVKQARFLYYYALNDGSLGMHNPAYVRDMLIKAEELLTP